MKEKITFLIIGILIGAIITAAGFLIFGGNKGKKDFDGKGFKDGNFNPPSGFSNEIDFKNFDRNNLPEGMQNGIPERGPSGTSENMPERPKNNE